jgi:hypothetical protein
MTSSSPGWAAAAHGAAMPLSPWVTKSMESSARAGSMARIV